MLVRLNRSEIGEKAALTIGLFLIATFLGQLVIPDLGFYGRDANVSLIQEIQEERLIAGCNLLDELQLRLRKAVLLIKDKDGAGTSFEDAETLAKYAGWRPGTDGLDTFVKARIA